MKVFIGADHRGFELKAALYEQLAEAGYEVIDVGALEYNKEDDYVDVARALIGHMNPHDDRGILLCGSGHGVDIAANRYPLVRSILGFNKDVVIQGREHEDANVLSLAADWLDVDAAWDFAQTFLTTAFSAEERHERRLHKLSEITVGSVRVS